VKEHVATVEREIDVGQAVVVVVADRDALSPAASSDAGLRGDVGERAVAVPSIQM
jgi:hypothetical protein